MTRTDVPPLQRVLAAHGDDGYLTVAAPRRIAYR